MPKFNFFPNFESRSAAVFFRLNKEFSPQAFKSTVDIVRILFSLIMLLRYSFTYDSALFFGQNPIPYIVLYVFLLLGFLTLYVSLALVIIEGLSPLFIAVKVNALLPFFLFFLGAGRLFSLDSLLKWKLPVPKFEENSFPSMRTYLLLPYGLMCFLAFFTHVRDPLWLNIESTEKIFHNPVITTAPGYLRNLPAYIYKTADVFQLLWEALFLPMIFFPLTLIFAGTYGLMFFLSSIFLINLSFLGHLEILVWVLVFHQEIMTIGKRLWKK